MHFQKYHALGNDYLVLDIEDSASAPSEEQIRLICHRNFGLGSDGILYGPLPTEKADFGLRIFNPDGGEAEKSGNGLRIFARHLFETGKVSDKPFTVETPGGIVSCQVSAEENRIRVEMGKVSFRSDVIPVRLTGEPREVIQEKLELPTGELIYCAATIGNPHCVVPWGEQELTAADAHRLGPVLEKHSIFPNRTNVQLLKVIDRQNIRIEIWERGAGYTLASGSSSSAAAAVAHRLGLVDNGLTVHMPGGQIIISIDSDYGITMTGPATRVGSMVISDEALAYSLPATE